MQVLRGREVIAAGEPRQVMQQQLGWDLPVAAIPNWLIGQPQPNNGLLLHRFMTAKQRRFSTKWSVLAQVRSDNMAVAEATSGSPA